MKSKVYTHLQFSKSSKFYLNTKKNFFNDNNALLKESLNQNKLYASQPNRKRCKICIAVLPKTVDFTQHNVDYVFCDKCLHLNGRFDDTKSFIEKLYISEGGNGYSKNYIDVNFLQRVTDIYLPKVDFLISHLPVKKYEVLDVGCGGGHFVYALSLRNLKASGLDVNKKLVNFGNSQILHRFNKSPPPLTCTNEDEFYKLVLTSNAKVVSAIGVIEHLRNPHKFFTAFKKSKAKYLYYSVPMFSFCVLLENVFKNVFPRQLFGDHTHLFTDSSIKKMNKIIGLKSIAEWRYGTDIIDLYRHILINLQANKCSKKTIDLFNAGLLDKIDNIQSIFDKSHFCSEIHLLASKY
jgi:SAM-dependent methyltransferase